MHYLHHEITKLTDNVGPEEKQVQHGHHLQEHSRCSKLAKVATIFPCIFPRLVHTVVIELWNMSAKIPEEGRHKTDRVFVRRVIVLTSSCTTQHRNGCALKTS